MAPFMDFVVGRGRGLVVELIAAYRDGYRDRESFLTSWPRSRCVRSERYEMIHDTDGTLAVSGPRDGAPVHLRAPAPRRQRLRDGRGHQDAEAEYGQWPPRGRKGADAGAASAWEGQVIDRATSERRNARENVVAMARPREARRTGRACVSDYPWIGDLLKIVEETVSSCRSRRYAPTACARPRGALARGGHRTLTMARKRHERLRRAIRKPITDEQITTACD